MMGQVDEACALNSSRYLFVFCALLVGLSVGYSGTQAPLSNNTPVTAPAKKAAPEESASSNTSAAQRRTIE